ncbi:hypothetical protein SF06_22360 [Pseudomonas flexibilis]|jgi:hypothetical protein|uniref:Uncharacterized protein n=1 Tax=Pseudomonas flexibilis TaxID=706570 RepID=A0A1N6UFM0_9PSED|nr:hypothetical protein [Pseudomonas flexibilis]KHL68900.1 hypothetical protein SF06_22360 [Pseudomonas flexibilis]SIQ64448.1 hypothetical protein SAMN05421672_108133 [Pseudomonas flexibilis]
MPQQLYAEIRKTSRYAHQAQRQRETGPYPFPVTLAPECDGYVVQGGYGGQYRLEDVHLIVLHEDGTQIRIS